ncbi:hypothetical protein LCGC14_2095590 [marine sediment metagenome]|uniref:DNA (cytosine-5-)-methyltransferase n=1 Tax=marine sediment metagenome TaxID=412755 RepID=A0A0F9EYT9_9ZZZZ|nr:DNA cytosine methyltransferase [bacterium]
MNNKDKIILDLCGGTGAWSKPYKDSGYDVRVITLPEYDIMRWREYAKICIPVEEGNVYGILAAPPCTMFSVARTVAKKPRDLRQGMELVIACLDIIWECQYKVENLNQRTSSLKFWALENPKGLLEWFLGEPVFQFQPYEFGDDYSKKTCLWGNFNKPKRLILTSPPPKGKTMKHLATPMSHKRDFKKMAELRSITPRGFAQAFFEANQ